MHSQNSGVEIGIRLQWWGVKPSLRGSIRPVRPGDIMDMIGRIEWNGRLFRDPRISRADAIALTRESIWDRPGFRFMDIEKRGFVFFGLPEGDTTRVHLIGVLPEYRKQGVGRALLAQCPTSYIVAGTYEDNRASCALYEKIGMQVIRREKVFNE